MQCKLFKMHYKLFINAFEDFNKLIESSKNAFVALWKEYEAF